MKPSASIVAAVGLGAPAAGVLSWLIDVIFAIKMPDHVEASVGVLIAAFIGYFFRGGRADDTAPATEPRAVRSHWIVTLLAALMAFPLLSGCTSTTKFIEENPTVARAGVQFATAKLIRLAGDQFHQDQRRARILLVSAKIAEEAEGVSVTVAALKNVAMSYVPTDLLPEDRIVAGLLIDAAANELLKRVGEGTLEGEQLLVLDKVLTWVAEGAAMTVPTTGQSHPPEPSSDPPPVTPAGLALLSPPPEALRSEL